MRKDEVDGRELLRTGGKSSLCSYKIWSRETGSAVPHFTQARCCCLLAGSSSSRLEFTGKAIGKRKHSLVDVRRLALCRRSLGGTQLRDLMNSGLTRWRLAVSMDTPIAKSGRKERSPRGSPRGSNHIQRGCGERNRLKIDVN